MPSPSNSAPPSGAAVSSVSITPPALPRPPRTWYFVGTTLFGLGVYAVEMIAQLATFIALFMLGYLRHRTGSTWLTVILHGAHNAVSIAQVALLIAFA